MAVSFKVPKSPKRDIAATDAFLGVDLTNTGANIEGYRSPHAPNMVRLVPGKVRKRMGYYKEVLFGTKTNVNFAKDTSAKEQEIVITSDDTATWVKIYDLIQTLSCGSSAPLYLDFDYKSEDTFNIVNSSVEVTASEEWEHISTTVYFTEDTDVEDIKFFSDNVQDIYIKNFSAMVERTEDYEWSPAPEFFVEREKNDPIYGVHYLRNGKDSFEGDRIVNVNRALDTSDEYVEKHTLQVNPMFPFLDPAYVIEETPGIGVTVTVDFDYTNLDTDIYGYLYAQDYEFLIPASLSREEHITQTFTINSPEVDERTLNYFWFQRIGSGQSITLSVKNFSVVYEKNSNYEWSPAPEDENEKFHFEDMYIIHEKEYEDSDSYDDEGTITNSEYQKTFNIMGADILKGTCYVSFDLTTDWEPRDSDTLIFSINSNSSYLWIERMLGADAVNKKKHYSLIIVPNSDNTTYVQSIVVGYNGTNNEKVYTKIENLKIRKYDTRDSYYVTPKKYLYHVGKDFYIRGLGEDIFRKVYEDANEHISRSFQLNNACYIIDGKDIYKYSIDGGGDVYEINEENAYIPTVTEAKEPSGGGTSVEALNMLQPGFIETFCGEANVKTYQLSFSGLDETKVKAWVLNSSGTWVLKKEGTDFTVNRNAGKVKFSTAPGAPPHGDGAPNVKIQAYRTVDGYRDRITKCTLGVLYGIGGKPDRIFLAGNPDHPNWDFYSQMDDPTYFPDVAYSVMGSEQSMITGYAVVSNYLATFKDGFDQSQSVFVREGDMLVTDEEKKISEPVFKLVNTLQGEGVVAPYSFGYLQTEPVFLTKAGIYAITEQDITGEKYSQNRSFYLDGKLRKETGLENAIATVYDNQYILALNGKLYVLDGLQATRTDKSEPYATRQYAGFLCEDIPATCLWTDDAVCFGTSDGKVCKFYTDVDSLSSYNDDGKAIYSCWETPDLDGQLFYKNKTFRYMAVRLMAALKTSVKLYSRRFGIWTLNDETAWTFIKGQTAIGNSLDFNNLDFNLFSFSADTTERVVHTKLRVKKVDKARFRVENGELDEPFGIFDLALEYIESGNYKG